ncbi:MAG: alpha/beta fold hydrolase, partial [Gaiellaceae bacterium]
MSARPFVLVHGSGGGAWNWDRVAPLLQDAGHEVVAPDLEMRDARVGIEDHAQHVIDAIGERRDVVLVGHSYAGMPAAVVVDRIPERIAHVVYLDAVAPSDGESFYDQRPDLRESIGPLVRDGFIPPIPPEWAGCDPEDNELLRSRLTTTPQRCWEEPVRLSGDAARVPRTYVMCTRSGFGGVADRCR